MLFNFILIILLISSPIFVVNLVKEYSNKKNVGLIVFTILIELIFIFVCSNYLAEALAKLDFIKIVFAVLHISQFLIFFLIIKAFNKYFADNINFVKLLAVEVILFFFFLIFFIKQDPAGMLYVLYFSLPSCLIGLLSYTYISQKSK